MTRKMLVRRKQRRQTFRVTVVRENDGRHHFDIRCQQCGRSGLALEGEIMRHAKLHMGEKDREDRQKAKMKWEAEHPFYGPPLYQGEMSANAHPEDVEWTIEQLMGMDR